MDRVSVGETGRVFGRVLDEHRAAVESVAVLTEQLAKAADAVATAFAADGRLLVCGNGGSAADAQHIAAEFVGRFLKERTPLSAIALHANTSAVTAIGNDYGFDEVFARQVRAHGRAGDVLLGISTSGNSANVIRAMDAAHERGLVVIGLSGGEGGPMAERCDVCLTVRSSSTPRIQEMHILLGHTLCELVEDALS